MYFCTHLQLLRLVCPIFKISIIWTIRNIVLVKKKTKKGTCILISLFFILCIFWGMKISCYHGMLLARNWSWWVRTLCSLQMTGIAWTVPAPVGEAVPPSAGLGSDPLMMNWEKITDRLKTAFPQQTRYLSLYLAVRTDYTL